MDKKQVTDLRSELLDSRFGAKSISTIAESKRFPLHEMRDDVAFQIINRSEERRVGKECRIGCRSRWSPYH